MVSIIVIQNPFNKEKSMMATGELQDSENTGINVGDLAPDFILESLENEPVQLSSFRGEKAVVVNFWATWCPPCREEMPAFEEKFLANKNKIEIIGVNLQETADAIEKFKVEIPFTFPTLMDPNKNVKELYNIFTQPVTYFIDKNGIIVDKKFGPLTSQEIEEKFRKLGVQ